MPALENPKHERFAQGLAKGKSQAEAYADAGYKPSEPNASRLTRNDKVQARVAELQEIGSLRAEVTIESLIREAGEIQEAAKQEKQYSAATAALTAKAKLAGLWIDKAENTNRNVVDPTQVSDAELAEVLKDCSGEGASAPPVDKAQLN
jgi:phage terminase small subunit